MDGPAYDREERDIELRSLLSTALAALRRVAPYHCQHDDHEEAQRVVRLLESKGIK